MLGGMLWDAEVLNAQGGFSSQESCIHQIRLQLWHMTRRWRAVRCADQGWAAKLGCAVRLAVSQQPLGQCICRAHGETGGRSGSQA